MQLAPESFNNTEPNEFIMHAQNVIRPAAQPFHLSHPVTFLLFSRARACVRACVRVCVCVCERERERERERVRACVRACVCVCEKYKINISFLRFYA